MAAIKENSDEQDRQIPVFTVLKNGKIYKNIFLLDPPSPISEKESMGSGEICQKTCIQQDEEEVLLIGRHPDCNIMLEHPSISRFHLRIHSRPSSQKLSVMDLSSVHGTWVSDQKIEPEVRIELREGDTLRFGTSSRIYRLHWFPLNRAFDVDYSLLLPIEENPLQSEETEMFQNENLSPSAPPMPGNMKWLGEEEDVMSQAPTPGEKEDQSPLWVLEQNGVLSMWESVNSSSLPAEGIFSKISNQEFGKENQENPQGWDFADNVLVEIENQESPRERLERKSDTPNLWSRRGKPASLIRIETGRSRKRDANVSRNVGVEAENQNAVKDDGIVPKVLFLGFDKEEEIFTPDKENFTPKTVFGSKSSRKGRIEEIKNMKSSGSLPLKVINDSNQVQDTGDELVPKVLFSDSDKEEEMFTPDKENMTPNSMKKGGVEEIKHRKVFGSPSPLKDTSNRNRDGKDTGMLTFSEKENLTPIVLHDWISKKPRSVTRLRQENEMIMNNRKEGRVPFQTLAVNSPSRSYSVNCSQTTGKSLPSQDQSMMRWYMVVDTSCLTNRESRRSLQLLEGLKRTQLIIPRMVIRELDCLKKRSSLFRRQTEASVAFQWIEECMMKTNWWIHIQNSMEEGMPIAPTPPASPRVNDVGTGNGAAFTCSSMFSTCGSVMEIASPTAHDYILECALLFKRIKNDGQIVLLSNNVAMKIKAMAEGLPCETAEDFRESLVDPWSERFLWVESTPRGPTWSCFEEASLLRENYHHHLHGKKSFKAAEGAKGLKLILLHNSHYGQMNRVTT